MRTALLHVAAEFQLDATFHRRISAVAFEQHHEGRPIADSSRPVLSDLAQRQTEVDLAAHMGVDPVADPSPGLVAGATIAVFASAYNEWIAPAGGTDLPDLVVERFGRLQRVLADLS
jgi:MftR C-terminal domain